MKLLITTVLLFGAGSGGFGLTGGRAADASDPCPYAGCKVEIECLDADTCLVTCYDDADNVVCQAAVDCTGPCDAACGVAEGCAR